MPYSRNRISAPVKGDAKTQVPRREKWETLQVLAVKDTCHLALGIGILLLKCIFRSANAARHCLHFPIRPNVTRCRLLDSMTWASPGNNLARCIVKWAKYSMLVCTISVRCYKLPPFSYPSCSGRGQSFPRQALLHTHESNAECCDTQMKSMDNVQHMTWI